MIIVQKEITPSMEQQYQSWQLEFDKTARHCLCISVTPDELKSCVIHLPEYLRILQNSWHCCLSILVQMNCLRKT